MGHCLVTPKTRIQDRARCDQHREQWTASPVTRNMELSEPDPDIHVDVDLMILDYLLCMTLESILSTGQVRTEENGEHNSIDSSIATIYGMRPPRG